MRVMVLIKATPALDSSPLFPTHLREQLRRFNADLDRAGVRIEGEGPLPAAGTTRVRCHGSRREIAPGVDYSGLPQVVGFWLWEVASMDEAIAWTRCCPSLEGRPCEFELRPMGPSLASNPFVTGLLERDQHLQSGLRARS
jgi:hypothetical protein